MLPWGAPRVTLVATPGDDKTLPRFSSSELRTAWERRMSNLLPPPFLSTPGW